MKPNYNKKTGQKLLFNTFRRSLGPGYHFGPHCHQNAEICLIESGACRIRVNDTTLMAEAGDLVILFPNMVHTFETDAQGACELFQFHMKELPKSWVRVEETVWPANQLKACLRLPCNDRLRSCITRIRQELEKNDQWTECITENCVDEMMYLVGRYYETGTVREVPVESPMVRQAIVYVGEHMREKILLPQIAQVCGVSPRHLSAVFKEKMGISINDYINILKVEESMSILEEQKISLADLSVVLGFSSTQYFCAVFKKYVTLTPSEYRRSREE